MKDVIYESWKQSLGDTQLSEEELRAKFIEDKKKFDEDVTREVNKYVPLNMQYFINRVGQEKIESMKAINEKLERSVLVNGKLVDKKKVSKNEEDLDEWKRGFMEGYDEAYRRIMSTGNNISVV